MSFEIGGQWQLTAVTLFFLIVPLIAFWILISDLWKGIREKMETRRNIQEWKRFRDSMIVTATAERIKQAKRKRYLARKIQQRKLLE